MPERRRRETPRPRPAPPSPPARASRASRAAAPAPATAAPGRIAGDQPPRRPDPALPAAVTALSREELEARVEALGFPRFHGRQVRDAVLRRAVGTFDGMTDLPRPLRDALAGSLRVATSTVAVTERSRDGTAKFLVRLEDGRSVESVLIPEGARTTLCVSTEVGCPVRCVFCASGLEGLLRPLGSHEVVEQVLHARRWMAAETPGRRITNVVLMGMGEPLLNYDAVVAAVGALKDPSGLDIGARRITLSTVGVVENIDRLAREGHGINLAVSLHAPDDATRDRIVPLNRRWGAEAVADAARRYARDTRRDVTFEYVLLEGINDTPEHARRLAALAEGAHINVNLIPHNRVEGLPYRPPSPEAVEAFAAIVRARRVPVHVRRRRGDDIAAACGQLRLKEDGPSASAGAPSGPGAPTMG